MPKSKAEIIEHLATVANVSKDQARVMLEGLVRMALREARTGFTIPGLCKIELVDRDARTMRHPQTGEMIEVPARKVLRMRPVQKAKDMVARVPHAADEPVEEVPMVKPPAENAEAPVNEPIFITFSCTSCGTQIEASTDMAGMESQCPGCGAPIKVPSATAINQLAGLESLASMQPAQKVEGPAGSQGEEEWQKGSTIKIEMPKGVDSPIPPVRRTIYIKRRK